MVLVCVCVCTEEGKTKPIQVLYEHGVCLYSLILGKDKGHWGELLKMNPELSSVIYFFQPHGQTNFETILYIKGVHIYTQMTVNRSYLQ